MQALDRDVAVVVVQGGQQPAQPGQRVADGTAEHPRVHRSVQQSHVDDQVDQTAQAGGEGGHVHGGVGGVGDDDDVGPQRVAVLGEQVHQCGRADLLLALDEERDADRWRAAEGPQDGEVHEHAGLVVRRSTAVEAAVALGRGEGRVGPLLLRPAGLDVEVGVEQHGGSALRCRPGRDDGWRACARAHDLDDRGPRVARMSRDDLRRPAYVVGPVGVGGDRRDPDQRLEVGARGRQHLVEPVGEGG